MHVQNIPDHIYQVELSKEGNWTWQLQDATWTTLKIEPVTTTSHAAAACCAHKNYFLWPVDCGDTQWRKLEIHSRLFFPSSDEPVKWWQLDQEKWEYKRQLLWEVQGFLINNCENMNPLGLRCITAANGVWRFKSETGVGLGTGACHDDWVLNSAWLHWTYWPDDSHCWKSSKKSKSY